MLAKHWKFDFSADIFILSLCKRHNRESNIGSIISNFNFLRFRCWKPFPHHRASPFHSPLQLCFGNSIRNSCLSLMSSFVWPLLIIIFFITGSLCLPKTFHHSLQTGKDYTIPSFFCCSIAMSRMFITKRNMFYYVRCRHPPHPDFFFSLEIRYFVHHKSN